MNQMSVRSNSKSSAPTIWLSFRLTRPTVHWHRQTIMAGLLRNMHIHWTFFQLLNWAWLMRRRDTQAKGQMNSCDDYKIMCLKSQVFHSSLERICFFSQLWLGYPFECLENHLQSPSASCTINDNAFIILILEVCVRKARTSFLHWNGPFYWRQRWKLNKHKFD